MATGPSADPPRYTSHPLPERRSASVLSRPGGTELGLPDGRASAARFDPAAWHRCEAYLYGVDLFNSGFWFECHEVLEDVWVAAGRATAPGRFLRGLIQLAAAHHHRERGNAAGAGRLSARAFERLAEVGDACLGVDASLLLAQSRAFFEARRSEPARIRLRLP